MKKRLLIGLGILLGALLLTAGVIAVFFPGIAASRAVSVLYSNMDRTIPAFDMSEIPEDFVRYQTEGLCISVPAVLQMRENGHGFQSADGKETPVFILATDPKLLAKFTPDLWEERHYDREDYEHFFRTAGVPCPETSDDLLWYCKGSLMPDTVLGMRGRDKKIFLEFAFDKQQMWETENTWELPLEGGKAYVCQGLSPMMQKTAPWSLLIFPEEGKNYHLIFRGLDDQTVRQIISSVTLAA